MQIETIWSLDPFQCSNNPPEPYRCYYCGFETNFTIEYNEHVERTKQENPHNLKLLIPNYTCEACKFETYSQFILLKHVCSSCTVDRDKDVLMLLYHSASQSLLLRRGYYGNVFNREKAEFLIASLRGEMAQNCKEILYYDSRFWQGVEGKTEIRQYTTGLPIGFKRTVAQPPKAKAAPPEPPGSWVKLCDRCGQQLSWSMNLKLHMIKKHTAVEDIQWFECSKCSYKAKVRNDLTKHMQIKHIDQAEAFVYECSVCSYTSTRSQYLRVHFKNCHAEGADVQWFRCKFCSFKSRRKEHTKRHEREQHRGDFKMFECEHCPYRAKQKIHMKLHVVQKHTPDAEVEWFRCLHCEYKAKLKASLKTHIVKKHSLDMKQIKKEH